MILPNCLNKFFDEFDSLYKNKDIFKSFVSIHTDTNIKDVCIKRVNNTLPAYEDVLPQVSALYDPSDYQQVGAAPWESHFDVYWECVSADGDSARWTAGHPFHAAWTLDDAGAGDGDTGEWGSVAWLLRDDARVGAFVSSKKYVDLSIIMWYFWKVFLNLQSKDLHDETDQRRIQREAGFAVGTSD